MSSRAQGLQRMIATDHIRQTVRAMAIALVLGAPLGGCSTAVVDHIPNSLGGLPEGVPQRPAVQPAYPAVHDMPAPREDTALSEAQRKRLQEDLKKARDRYAPTGKETTSANPLAAGAPRAP